MRITMEVTDANAEIDFREILRQEDASVEILVRRLTVLGDTNVW